MQSLQTIFNLLQLYFGVYTFWLLTRNMNVKNNIEKQWYKYWKYLYFNINDHTYIYNMAT